MSAKVLSITLTIDDPADKAEACLKKISKSLVRALGKRGKSLDCHIEGMCLTVSAPTLKLADKVERFMRKADFWFQENKQDISQNAKLSI